MSSPAEVIAESVSQRIDELTKAELQQLAERQLAAIVRLQNERAKLLRVAASARECRAVQTQYFRTREPRILVTAKRREVDLDRNLRLLPKSCQVSVAELKAADEADREDLTAELEGVPRGHLC